MIEPLSNLTVTVVIPTYREAGNIGRVVSGLAPLVGMFIAGIVVVDDASDDGTPQEAAHAGATVIMRRKGERGLSSAVRCGAEYAQTPRILVMDGDGQHPCSAVLPMIVLGEQAEIVLGSRFANGSALKGFPAHRVLISKALNAAVNLRAMTRSSDPMSGFVLAPRELILQTRTNGFKWAAEILMNRRCTIAEHPITFEARTAGESKASFKEVLALMRTPKWKPLSSEPSTSL